MSETSANVPTLSRSKAAIYTLLFGYIRYAVVFVSAFVTLPSALMRIEPETYAQWIVALELLGFIGFAELGLGAVVPWVVAERVGREDLHGLRLLLADIRLCGWVTIGIYAASFGIAWLALAERLSPTGDVLTAVLIVGVATPVSLFGRLASGVLAGFQDVKFLAATSLSGDILAVSLTLGLILAGAGPVGLAVGVVTPWLVVGGAAVVRLIRRHPELAVGLPGATFGGVRRLFRDGFGAWLGGVGGRLTLGCNALLLSLSGVGPLDLVRFVMTAKLVEMLTQQAWQVTDCGLIGLAQVRGSGNTIRVRELTRLILRLGMVASGGVAVIVLVLNPAFVVAWLGSDKFAGPEVNIGLAALVIALTLTHAQAACAAVLGRRLEVGAITAGYGVVYAAAAFGLVRALGSLGVPLSGVVIGLTVGATLFGWLIANQDGTPLTDVAKDFAFLWLPRAAVPLAVAAAVGWLPAGQSLAIALPAVMIVGVGYIWACRPLLSGLPLPPRLRQWAERVRLLPRSGVWV